MYVPASNHQISNQDLQLGNLESLKSQKTPDCYVWFQSSFCQMNSAPNRNVWCMDFITLYDGSIYGQNHTICFGQDIINIWQKYRVKWRTHPIQIWQKHMLWTSFSSGLTCHLLVLYTPLSSKLLLPCPHWWVFLDIDVPGAWIPWKDEKNKTINRRQ